MTDNRKVLVIGLDGATPELLMKLIIEGKLPHLSKIMNNGVYGTLKSVMPPFSSPAWLSFMTGKNPGKLGIFSFQDRKPGTYEIRVANFQSINSKSIWEILSEHGKKVGVLAVPTTFPPRKVNGFLVSGWPIPQGRTFTYPNDLQSKLYELTGVYETDRIWKTTWRFASEDKFLKGLYVFTEKEVKTTKYLMNKYDWNFFVTVFEGIDAIQHFFWKYMDRQHPLHSPKGAEKYGNEIIKFYQKIDEIINELLNSVDDSTTVVIMSDHGAGALHYYFNINQWLIEKGLLKIKGKGSSPLTWLPRLVSNQKKIVNLFTRLGLMRVYYPIADRITLLGKLMKNILTYPPLMNADWSNTKAYGLGVGNFGQIYINLKGREPEGSIESGKEYEELRNYLIEELRNLTDPKTNRQMVVEVFKKEEIYSGEYVDQAPDVTFFIDELRVGIDHTLGHDAIFTYDLSNRHDNAGHRMNGILLMRGKNIKKGLRVEGANLIDLAPTILYTMNVPVPFDMDGKVLINAFTSSYIKSNPIKYQKVTIKPRPSKYEWSKEDEEKIKERLKMLGYLG